MNNKDNGGTTAQLKADENEHTGIVHMLKEAEAEWNTFPLAGEKGISLPPVAHCSKLWRDWEITSMESLDDRYY